MAAIKQHLGGSKKTHLGANKQHLGLIWVIYSSDLGHSIGTFLKPWVSEIEGGYPERYGGEEEGLVLEYSSSWIVTQDDSWFCPIDCFRKSKSKLLISFKSRTIETMTQC